MPLIKSEFPIFEYDTEKRALLMPEQMGTCAVPETAVLLFMNAEIDAYVASHTCQLLGTFETITKVFSIYQTEIRGKQIAFVQAPLGGPAAVQILEQMIAGGARSVIAVGCCGALEEGTEGDFFVPTSALRQEGTSYQYLPPSREVELSETVTVALEKTLAQAGLPCRRCKTWTTDGLYRETQEMIRYRKSEGCSVVDMECASLAACAQMRGVLFGQLLFTADSLANEVSHDGRNWGQSFFATAMELALQAASEL